MPEWAWVWRAWHDLDSGRQWIGGFGAPAPRRLSWADLRVWAEDNRLPPDDEADLHHLIGEMEAEFSLIQAERRSE
jgi:hypothetical protein